MRILLEESQFHLLFPSLFYQDGRNVTAILWERHGRKVKPIHFWGRGETNSHIFQTANTSLGLLFLLLLEFLLMSKNMYSIY